MKVRLAEKNDFEAIRKIYRETLSNWWFISSEQHQKDIKEGRIYVVEENGEVKGYAKISKSNKILELAVSRNHQNKGLGKTLINFLKAKYNYLYVTTNQAYEFYLKQGFLKVGVTYSKKNNIPMYSLVWSKIAERGDLNDGR